MKPKIEATSEIFSISQERLQAFKMAEKIGFFRQNFWWISKFWRNFANSALDICTRTKSCNYWMVWFGHEKKFFFGPFVPCGAFQGRRRKIMVVAWRQGGSSENITKRSRGSQRSQEAEAQRAESFASFASNTAIISRRFRRDMIETSFQWFYLRKKQRCNHIQGGKINFEHI